MADGAALTQALRERGPTELARLLRARPDLVHPIPAGLTEVVARALSRPSTLRVLARLDDQSMRVLSGVAAEVDAELLDGLGGRPLADVLDDLSGLGLVAGEPPRTWRTVRQLFGPQPAGLAPASADPMPASRLEAALDQLSTDDHAVLDRMVWGPPYGSVERATRRAGPDGGSPIDRLLGLGLLRPVDEATVLLPREVALALRGDRLYDLAADLPALPRFDMPTDDEPSEASRTMLEALAAWLLGELAPGDWRAVLDAAAADDHWVRLAYATDDGSLGLDVVRVLFVGHGSAFLVRRAGPRLNVPLARVVAAEAVAPVVIHDLPVPRDPA